MNFNPTLHRLSNGIAVFIDPMDIETVAMKILIKGGTRIEAPHEYGMTHFLEHMVFTGTKRHPTAKEMRDFLSDRGGTRGASTYLHKTEYRGRILAENLDVLVDCLSDMVLEPKLSEDCLDSERGIVIQEINRSIDNQGRQFAGLVKRSLFPGSYLAKYDGLGTVESVNSFTAAGLEAFRRAKYTADSIIIGISGKIINPDAIVAQLESRFGAVPGGAVMTANPGVVNPSIVYDVRDDKKQTKIFLGFEDIYPVLRKYDYELMCLGTFMGALTRRLVEEIFDKRGLAYDFDPDGFGDRDLGVDGFYTSLSPEKLGEMIATIATGCYDILHRNPVTDIEIKRRNIMRKLGRADFIEDATRRCDKLLDFYADHGELYNPAEYDALREKLNPDDVMKHSAGVFTPPISIIAQGPKCDLDLRAAWGDNFK